MFMSMVFFMFLVMPSIVHAETTAITNGSVCNLRRNIQSVTMIGSAGSYTRVTRCYDYSGSCFSSYSDTVYASVSVSLSARKDNGAWVTLQTGGNGTFTYNFSDYDYENYDQFRFSATGSNASIGDKYYEYPNYAGHESGSGGTATWSARAYYTYVPSPSFNSGGSLTDLYSHLSHYHKAH